MIQRTTQATRSDDTDTPSCLMWRRGVVAGLLISGLIHLGLTPEHIRSSLLLGLGFLGVALLEVSLGVAFVRRPAPAFWPAGVAVAVFSITAYVVSRTTGLPFEHEHGSESIQVLDVVCKAAELLSSIGLVASIHQTTRTWPAGPSPRLAPWSRYAYLIAIVLTGAVAALLVIHIGGHLFGHQAHQNPAGTRWSPGAVQLSTSPIEQVMRSREKGMRHHRRCHAGLSACS